MRAAARAEDASLGAAERGAAIVEMDQAHAAYAALVAEAEASLKAAAGAGKPRTHMLIVGVGLLVLSAYLVLTGKASVLATLDTTQWGWVLLTGIGDGPFA